ncbi:hypothetical protein ACYSNM_12945 [Myroides sp. LJL116]
MEITSKSGEVITLEKAIKYVSLFQEKNPEAIKSYFVGVEKLQELLKQDNCIGMRIYPGINEQTDKTNLVLVGVDTRGNDISEGVILEELIICPPFCSVENSLLNRK